MPKVEIHLEITVPSEPLAVNQVIALFQQIQAEIGPVMVASYLEATQDTALDKTLGPKWADEPQREAPWTCPRCGSRRGFTRRGSRSRTLRKSSLGRVPFALRQVTCKACQSTFSPFPSAFDLAPHQVSTTEFQAKTVEVACQVTYARSVAFVRDLAGVDVSTTAVHAWVQSYGEKVKFDAVRAEGQTVVLDSTLVRAGTNKRGSDLNLGLSLEGRRWTEGRPRLEIHPVCFGVGETWAETGQKLAQQQPSRLVYDGDEAVTHWAERSFVQVPKQRCLWHLVRQLYLPLREDGLNKRQARVWMKELSRILFCNADPVPRTRARLRSLILQLQEEGYGRAAGYLARAEPSVLTYRQKSDGMFFDEQRLLPCAIRATSPVERQMRELNRRTDVGARWHISGVANLIGLDLVRRFDPDQWRALWRLPVPVPCDSLVVKLQLRVLVRPPPNVNTT